MHRAPAALPDYPRPQVQRSGKPSRLLLDPEHSTLPKDRLPTARDLEEELISLLSDVDRPGSLTSTLSEVLRVGGNVRERLSSEMSRLIVAP